MLWRCLLLVMFASMDIDIQIMRVSKRQGPSLTHSCTSSPHSFFVLRIDQAETLHQSHFISIEVALQIPTWP
jgi:hypothetical protein